DDGGLVDRLDGAEIQHFRGDALAGQFLSHLEAVRQHQSVGDQAQILAFPFDIGLADRHHAIAVGHLALAPSVTRLVRENEAGIGRIPLMAAPIATPTMHDSASGESITRYSPYFLYSPSLARKTPPR